MMSLTFGLFNQVSGLGPLGPLVCSHSRERKTPSYSQINMVDKHALLIVWPSAKIETNNMVVNEMLCQSIIMPRHKKWCGIMLYPTTF